MASTTKFRVKCGDSALATKSNLLKICANFSIKIQKVFPVTNGFNVICASLSDIDKIFECEVLASFTDCAMITQLPPKLAERSILIKGVDASIYEHTQEEISAEVMGQNSWATVKEVFKFTDCKTIKLVFSNTDMVCKSCESGLNIFYLHIPPSEVERVEYVDLLTCYRCYSVNEHLARNCLKEDSYIVCSICSAIGHT